MLTRTTSLFALLAAVILAGATASVQAQARQQGRLLTAAEVLDELRGARDQAIPDRLLERAYGIAVIPDVTKVAWFLGGGAVTGCWSCVTRTAASATRCSSP